MQTVQSRMRIRIQHSGFPFMDLWKDVAYSSNPAFEHIIVILALRHTRHTLTDKYANINH